MTHEPVSQYSARQLSRYRAISTACASLALAIGASGFLGWILDNDFLKRIHPSLVTMKANTAICLTLISVSVLLLREPSSGSAKRRAGQICAAVVAAVALLTLSEHLFGWDLHIDQLLFHETVHEAGLSFPGRMGVASTLNFILLGVSLLFLNVRSSRHFRISNVSVLLVLAVTLLVFLYYFYGIEGQEPIAVYFTIALHTVIAFLSICAAILFSRPDRGLVALLLGNSPGSVVARRMWPVMLIVVLLGWARTIGRHAGWFGPGFATAAFVLSILSILLVLIWWTAVSLNRTDRERRRAETERERLLESEKKARDAAEKANQLKDEFLATLSHELRNPLNVILGYSELLLRMPEIEGSARLRQMAEALRRNARSQSQLINDLLDLSRLQRGKIALNQETLSLAAIVDNAVETVRAEAAAKGIEIQLAVKDQFLLVDGDRLRLQQIAWNLLNNAVKFTPPGGTIKIQLNGDVDHAALVVEDTGQGIDRDFLPHVFEMFRQADGSNSRRHGGLGIGLALVQQLVQLHQGTILAESAGANRGSRFTIQLPLTREAPSAELSAPPPLPPLNPVLLPSIEFLIVDDSEDTVAMLQQFLKLSGAKVTTATNGLDALRVASDTKFDVILSDISMPEMDGFEFLERLRHIPGRERVPVVAITGFGRSNDIERARSSGFYAHLTKPLDLDALVAVLKQLTQERSLGGEGVVSTRKFTYSSSLKPRNSGSPASDV